jgi:hypothetical protein
MDGYLSSHGFEGRAIFAYPEDKSLRRIGASLLLLGIGEASVPKGDVLDSWDGRPISIVGIFREFDRDAKRMGAIQVLSLSLLDAEAEPPTPLSK